MAKFVYDEGLEEEKSDIADTFEARKKQLKEVDDLRNIHEASENSPSNRIIEVQRKRGLSGIFSYNFNENTSTNDSPDIDAEKGKAMRRKKTIRPSSRQRKKTLIRSVKKEKDSQTKEPQTATRVVRLDSQRSLNDSIAMSAARGEVMSKICSRKESSVFNPSASFKSLDVEEEQSTPPPPPLYIPAYYEYQQRRLLKRRRRRNYIWRQVFFGVYRRRNSIAVDDEIQTEILSSVV